MLKRKAHGVYRRGYHSLEELDQVVNVTAHNRRRFGGSHTPLSHSAAIARGFSKEDGTRQLLAEKSDPYLKPMYHPCYPNGAAHRLLVKDYRGKDAKQEIWKFDGSSISKIIDALKQAAIEEGQWNEKREAKGSLSIDMTIARLHAGRDRVAAAKRAADEAASRRLFGDA
jgi:hypothetical protein